MCNVAKEFQKFGHQLHKFRHSDLVPRPMIPMSAIMPGCCAECGRPMSHQEIWGAPTPRTMCDGCYQGKVVHNRTRMCLECGGSLPHEKIQAHQSNPRELRAMFHEGACWLAYIKKSGVVLGLAENSEAAPARPGLPLHREDAIDVDYRITHEPGNRPALPPPPFHDSVVIDGATGKVVYEPVRVRRKN